MKNLIILIILTLSACGTDHSGSVAISTNPDGTPTVKGEKGEKGDKGEKGEKGDPGIGQTGASGSQGAPGTIVNGSMFYDTISQKYWLIPSLQKAPTLANAQSACGTASNYRLPNTVELSDAQTRGLKAAADAISAPTEAWTLKDTVVASNNGTAAAWQDLGNGQLVSEQYIRASNVIDNLAGFYCIQK